jgi:hypothetical protein
VGDEARTGSVAVGGRPAADAAAGREGGGAKGGIVGASGDDARAGGGARLGAGFVPGREASAGSSRFIIGRVFGSSGASSMGVAAGVAAEEAVRGRMPGGIWVVRSSAAAGRAGAAWRAGSVGSSLEPPRANSSKVGMRRFRRSRDTSRLNSSGVWAGGASKGFFGSLLTVPE